MKVKARQRDAIEQALEMANYFYSNGIEVYFLDLPEKDPSELGFKSITELIRYSDKITPQKLLEYKINAYWSWIR